MNKKIDDTFAYELPYYLKKEIDDYVEKGIAPDKLCRAIIANNLVDALKYRPDENIKSLTSPTIYIMDNVPPEIKGSYDAVNVWIKTKGENHE